MISGSCVCCEQRTSDDLAAFVSVISTPLSIRGQLSFVPCAPPSPRAAVEELLPLPGRNGELLQNGTIPIGSGTRLQAPQLALDGSGNTQ